MRKELCCPQIIKDGRIIGYGGDQEWFPGDFQRLAGCGSVTGSNIAALYAMNKDEFKSLYQPEEGQDAKEQEQYLKLMQTMYQYMKPEFMGYPLIGRFAKDFKRYAADRGIEFKSEQLFLPKSKEQALDFIDTDELLEITPKSIRIRKKILDPTLRMRAKRAMQSN